jgi:glycosyltransferase involved in cell wall biosynthesis
VRPGALQVGLFSLPPLAHGGGFEEYLIALANSLTDRGHRVLIVNASAREIRVLRVALNFYYRNPLHLDMSRATTSEIQRRLGKARLLAAPLWHLARLLRGCDVVYTKNEVLELSVLCMLRPAKLPPIVCGIHTPLWYPRAISRQARLHNRIYLSRVYRFLLAGVTAVHVLNSHDASLVPRVHGWPSDRLIHIPHWYVTETSKPSCRAASDEPFRVLWGARMTEQKGVDTLLSIIDVLNQGVSAGEYAFVIAGSGDPRLEASVRLATERYANVRYLGHVPHDQMGQLYDDADMALVTSNWETFGYACLEPQSRGVPVAATNVPGCADIVEHDVTGFLFRPGDAAAGAAAVSRLKELHTHPPDEFQSMRRHTWLRVRDRFNPAAINDALEHALLTVANEQKVNGSQGAC